MKIFVLIAWGFLSGCGSVPMRTTICTLTTNVIQHEASRVVVSGEVHGGLDRLLLSDRSCPAEPVALSISNAIAEKPNVAPMWSAIYRQGDIGTYGKRIHATVVGTFHYVANDWPNGVLIVEDVSGLEVTLKKGN